MDIQFQNNVTFWVCLNLITGYLIRLFYADYEKIVVSILS